MVQKSSRAGTPQALLVAHSETLEGLWPVRVMLGAGWRGWCQGDGVSSTILERLGVRAGGHQGLLGESMLGF